MKLRRSITLSRPLAKEDIFSFLEKMNGKPLISIDEDIYLKAKVDRDKDQFLLQLNNKDPMQYRHSQFYPEVKGLILSELNGMIKEIKLSYSFASPMFVLAVCLGLVMLTVLWVSYLRSDLVSHETLLGVHAGVLGMLFMSFLLCINPFNETNQFLKLMIRYS